MQDGQEKYQIEFDFEQIPLSQHTFDKKEQLMAQNQQQPHQSNKLQQLMEPSEVQKQGLSIQSLQAIEQNDKQDLFQQQVVMDEQQLLLEQQVDQSLKIVQMDDTLQFLKQQVEMKENQNLPQQQVEMELQQYQPLQHEEDKQHQLPKQQEELNEHHHLSQQHHQTYEDYIQMNYQQFNVNLDDAHAKHSQSDISDDDDTDNSKWEPATQSQNEEDKSSELSEDRVFFVTYEQYVRIMRDQNAIIQGLQEYARYQASIQNQGASSPAIHADVTDEDNNQNQDSSGDTLSAKYSSNIEINSQTISNSQQQQVSQASHGNILNLLHQESQIQIQPNNVQASNNDQNEDIDENHDDQCLFIISQLLIIVIILVTMLVTTIIEMA
ncbi:hypothetical protein OXYTRIMIC_047 [Oxytricha trifallax]|uniref:Uncharacterized protein n=1 Tax=Oxytricha trifallax TaxID=1172189 RepID=A0A073I0T1_9SPIT|nr:hypothetical protein OXYTRIMIC_047 [Oxytricha trifallax]